MKRHLFTADWHITDKSLLDRLIGSDYFERKCRVLKGIVRWAIEKKVTDFYILGDIFHTYEPSVRLRIEFFCIIRELVENNIDVHILGGNHDINKSCEDYLSELSIFGNTDSDSKHYPILRNKVHVYRDTYRNINHSICAVPWNCRHMPDMPSRIVLGHDSISGFKMSDGYTYNDKTKTKKEFENIYGKPKYRIMGHFHIPQNIGNIYYCGSPYPITFNEILSKKRFLYMVGEKIKSIKIKNGIEFIKLDLADNGKGSIPSDCNVFNNTIVRLTYDSEKVYPGTLERVKTILMGYGAIYVHSIPRDKYKKSVSLELNENNVSTGLMEYIKQTYDNEEIAKLSEKIVKKAEYNADS